jgi:hypothetical protein
LQAANSGSQTLGRDTNKNLNMLGRSIMGEGQDRLLGPSDPLAVAMAREYGSVNPTSAYNHGIGMSSTGPRMEQSERDRLHAQANVSHSTLANSGNAAILGHGSNLNGLKMNSNNNNFTQAA